MKRAIAILLILAGIGAGVGAYYMRRGGGEVQISTVPVTRGEIVSSVGATGALQAVTTVQIGSQVSGNVAWLGADFNSIVKSGQVIARIDPSMFQTQVEQARANLARAQADVERNRVALEDAETKFRRATELAARELVSQSDLDAAKVAVDAAKAQLQSARAQVVQAQASLNQNQVNLDHTVITTPIDGIVIQRSVDVGQTVAASLQSPTLFIIAADLTKMQVNANIDEADVGQIRPGQHVTFRVDAYAGEDFEGTVSQVRLQPVVVQNVTTYGTIIDVPNPDLKLKPGMTANLRVHIARRADVLRVPNAALRFRPTAEMFAALNQPVPPELSYATGGGRGAGGFPGRAGTPAGLSTPQAAPANASAKAPAPPETRSQSAPASASDGPSAETPAASGGRGVFPPGSANAGGRGGGRGGFGGFGGGDGQGADGTDFRARMMERFKTMTPDEQRQFIARMKERGVDTSSFEQAAAPAAPQAKTPSTQSAETIDALFAPLPPVESQGRVWTAVDRQLKPVRLRLGITDGTNTELLEGDLQPGEELVTGIQLPGAAQQPQQPAGASGNPLLPQPGRGFRGGFRGGF
jgi:HlyD family secretion protein